MSARRPATACLLAAALIAAASAARAEGLDWEVREDPDAALPVRALRNVRDGVLGVGDAFLDLNTALFGEASLLVGQITMAASDAVGLVDDNPASEHVTKGILSKSLARTAYLWHVAGAESVLGGHGMAKERWVAGEVAAMSPLLSEADVEAVEGPLPLPPRAFVGEGLVHGEVYRPHALLLDLGAIAAADVVMRPAAGLLRIVQLRGAGDALERRAEDWVRRAVRTGW